MALGYIHLQHCHVPLRHRRPRIGVDHQIIHLLGAICIYPLARRIGMRAVRPSALRANGTRKIDGRTTETTLRNPPAVAQLRLAPELQVVLVVLVVLAHVSACLDGTLLWTHGQRRSVVSRGNRAEAAERAPVPSGAEDERE